MHGTPKNAPEITVTEISGILNVKGNNSQTHPSLAGKLSTSPSSTSTIKSYEHVHDHNVDLEIDLDSNRIEAIEQIRLGGDLTFSIDLYATAIQNENSVQLHRQVYELVVNQSDWIKILENIGYRKTVFLEIPVPLGNTYPSFNDATKHLENAQKQMLHGHYREAVAACRDALESLNRLLNVSDENIPSERKERNKMERISAIRREIYNFTSAAKHSDKTTSEFEWYLADAKASISMIAILLQWESEEGNNS